MSVARIALVAVIALSLAMVPAVAGALAASQSTHESMSDCGSVPCKAADSCAAVAACTLMCFNFLEAAYFKLVLTPGPHVVEASCVDKAVHPHPGSPPTRPPPA